MPPKGSKSPRTKSPKNAKGAGAAVTWETSITTTSVNEVRDTWRFPSYSFDSLGELGHICLFPHTGSFDQSNLCWFDWKSNAEWCSTTIWFYLQTWSTRSGMWRTLLVIGWLIAKEYFRLNRWVNHRRMLRNQFRPVLRWLVWPIQHFLLLTNMPNPS